MGAVDLAPYWWTDGDHAGCSMEIKHIDEETISYHAYLHLMLLCDFLLVLVLDTRREHRTRKSLIKIPVNCFLPYMCNRQESF
jgi:hypothetical protein